MDHHVVYGADLWYAVVYILPTLLFMLGMANIDVYYIVFLVILLLVLLGTLCIMPTIIFDEWFSTGNIVSILFINCILLLFQYRFNVFLTKERLTKERASSTTTTTAHRQTM